MIRYPKKYLFYPLPGLWIPILGMADHLSYVGSHLGYVGSHLAYSSTGAPPLTGECSWCIDTAPYYARVVIAGCSGYCSPGVNTANFNGDFTLTPNGTCVWTYQYVIGEYTYQISFEIDSIGYLITIGALSTSAFAGFEYDEWQMKDCYKTNFSVPLYSYCQSGTPTCNLWTW